MSAEAVNYVDKLRTAPNGEKVTPREKALLRVIATWHHAEKKAAWPKISTVAEALGVERKTAQKIIARCVRKRVIWSEQRFKNKQQLSSFWHFTELDGKETKAAAKLNERQRERGRIGYAKMKSTISTGIHNGVPQNVGTPSRKTSAPPADELRHLGPAKRRHQRYLSDPIPEPKLEPVLADGDGMSVEMQNLAERLQQKLRDRRREAGDRRHGMQRADFASVQAIVGNA